MDEERDAAALARRHRSEQGQPVVGRIPNGPHRLAEARAHLAREIAIHQAKLDRYAALIAAGKKPMGRPPVPMEDSTRIARARRRGPQRRGRGAGSRGRRPVGVAGEEAPEGRREHHRSAVADHADPARVPAGIQRSGRGHQRPADRRGPGGAVPQRPRMLHPDDARHAGCSGTPARRYRERRSPHRHRAGRRRLQQRRQPERRRAGPVDRPGQRTGPGPRRRRGTSPRVTTSGCDPTRGRTPTGSAPPKAETSTSVAERQWNPASAT